MKAMMGSHKSYVVRKYEGTGNTPLACEVREDITPEHGKCAIILFDEIVAK